MGRIHTHNLVVRGHSAALLLSWSVIVAAGCGFTLLSVTAPMSVQRSHGAFKRNRTDRRQSTMLVTPDTANFAEPPAVPLNGSCN